MKIKGAISDSNVAPFIIFIKNKPMTPTKDTLRVAEARLRHEIIEAYKKYYRKIKVNQGPEIIQEQARAAVNIVRPVEADPGDGYQWPTEK